MADLAYMRRQKLDKAIVTRAKKGTPVIGICSGFQMLGKTISNPGKIELSKSVISSLGLLDIETVFVAEKKTTQVKAKITANTGLLAGVKGMVITGYEIHMGQTNSNKNPVLQVIENPRGKPDYSDGAMSESGWVFGSYLHGLFHNTDFVQALINNLQ
jgi:adenosylcobyric acid synthase